MAQSRIWTTDCNSYIILNSHHITPYYGLLQTFSCLRHCSTSVVSLDFSVCVCREAYIKEQWVVDRKRKLNTSQMSWTVVEVLTAGGTHLVQASSLSHIKHTEISDTLLISEETHLFVVCWPQGQIIQAVRGHISNRIKKLGVGDCLHTQLPESGMTSLSTCCLQNYVQLFDH